MTRSSEEKEEKVEEGLSPEEAHTVRRRENRVRVKKVKVKSAGGAEQEAERYI